MKGTRAFTLALVVAPAIAAVLAGCPPPPPTAADTAKYLGLVDKKVFTYDVTGGATAGITETHEIRKSSLLPDAKNNPDGLVFDMLAHSSGFPVDDRTFSIEVSVTSAFIVRFFDCVSECGVPSKPIELAGIPFKSGGDDETDVDVVVTGGQHPGTSHEKHTFLVADSEPTSVPAGNFTATTVGWTRVQGADPPLVSTLKIAPDEGIVAWDTFDNVHLELHAK